MPFVMGSMVLDAPASALNNAGSDTGAKTDNAIVVKKIPVQGGYMHPYVSAQAVRYWIRTNLELNADRWKAAPVRREGKIAYTDSDPLKYWDDDLFGYMRAPSKKTDAAKDAAASPLEKDREITRISPLRVGTFVSISPTRVVSDFGTMTRQQGDPVPYEHEFYRAHLLGLLSLDLTASGTFFDGARVGFKNLDSFRRKAAEEHSLEKLEVRKQTAFRLPLAERVDRVTTLIGSLALHNGGAKQTVHYTELTPAIVFLAVTKNGNNPFYRMLTSTPTHITQFHEPAFQELMSVYKSSFLSKVYIGWAQGFLDHEREKLEGAISKLGDAGPLVTIDHPVSAIEAFTKELGSNANPSWYD